MKTRSTALVLPALLAAALALSACGKKAPLDEPPPREEKKQSERVDPIPSV